MATITLLTDFGLHDSSAATVKGVLLSALPGANIIDISHEVPPFQVKQGGYLLGTVWRDFPAGTFHIAIIDVYYGQLPKLALFEHEGHYFLAPDNGIIPMAIGAEPKGTWLCFELTNGKTFNDWIHAAANTIKLLRSQTPAQIGLQPLVSHKLIRPPMHQGRETPCEVIYIDHYGNVVTDMTREKFNSPGNGGRFRLNFMRVNEITAISSNYNDVPAGENLCRFNRNGYLEICVNQGSASSLFGLRAGSKHNDIKITFE